MKKLILLIIIFLSQGIMSWGQSDTLSYESIVDYYNRKTNMIEFYQLSENYEKVSSLTKERDAYIDALGESYGKGLFCLERSIEYDDLGDYKNAIKECCKAIEIYKKVLGTECLEYAAALNHLACYKARFGNTIEAIRLEKEAIKIRKMILGTMHPDYVISLANLAGFYNELGSYQEAIRLGTKAAEIKKELFGTDNPSYATSLNTLGCCFSDIGNFPEAIRLEMEALEIRRKVLGGEHPDCAMSLANLADLYCDLGNFPEAIRLGTEATRIMKNNYGTGHPDYATILDNLACYYSDVENYQEAILLCTEAMEIRKRIFGNEHLIYATSLNNLASLYSHLGNYREAIRMETESMDILKKTFGLDNSNYATSLSNLAFYNYGLGNYSEAIQLESEAMKIRKKVLGMDHFSYVTSLFSLSKCHLKYGNYTLSYDYLYQLIKILQQRIFSSFSELSSTLQISLWNNKYAFSFNTLFPSIVFRNQTKESISELYDKTALFSKGILLNSSISRRKLILESGDSLIMSKYDTLVFNKCIFDKQLEKPINERVIDMDSLRFVIQRQEMELAHDSKAYGDFAHNLRINWKDVQNKLGSDDIAIEFLDFPLYGTDSTMYVALTLKQGYNIPHLTTLFEKRQLMSIPEDDYYTHTDLYNLIWKPLDAELAGVKNVYFSPSGELHRIGIEYIPVTTTENVCDKYSLYRLSSTRQLAYIQDYTKGEKSVVYGGLKYDAVVSDTIPASPSTRENRSYTFVPRAIVDSLDIRGSYKYLPGTKEEADHIVSYLNTHSIPYKYYYGAAGTEESFKGLDGSKPKTLHIATHGFYMTEQDAERKNFARPLLQEETRVYHEDKPMTRSGLLLSGCSRALNHENIPDGIEDGILTADEISKLDLRGLALVVLSACQTGLGDITSGEGVFGLQRGFKNAGAKTIIMSLWNVSDFATQILMTSFYEHYLNGMPKEEAFRKAQDELRKQIDYYQDKPDWAAFVMLDGIN